MRAMKCDRCGQLYEAYDGVKIFKKNGDANALLLIDKDVDNKYWSRETYDLCPDCMKTLCEFLGTEGSKE